MNFLLIYVSTTNPLNLKSFPTRAFLQISLLCVVFPPLDNMHSHTQSLARSLLFSLPHIFIVFVPIFNFRLACKLCCAFFLLFCLFRFASKKLFCLKVRVCVCVCIRVCSASQRVCVCVCVCKRVYYFLITANFALCFIISILRLLCLSSAVSRRFSDAVRDAAEGGGRRQRRLRRRRRQRRKRTIRLNWFTVERKQTDLFILDVHRELRS